MMRNDGSVQSANSPVWGNRYQIRDYGLYRGVVNDVIHTDHEDNNSGLEEANEVLYGVMIIGGDRDGQLFRNVRLMRGLGGFGNFEEITLKKLEGLTGVDPSSTLALADLPIANMPRWNGDVVYIQFLSGDPNLPIIIGMGYHQAAQPEATKDEGPRYIRKFNGVAQEITRDGEFTWSKDNGAFLPVAPPTPDDPLYPLVSQFVAITGQEEAVKVSLNNEYLFKFEYLLGLNVSIDGIADEFALATTSGASFKMTGLETDSFILATVLGTSVKIEGGSVDAVTLGTAVGTMIKVDGVNDIIQMAAAFGDQISISAKEGIQATTPTGVSLSMKQGALDAKSGGGAFLTLDKTGFVKLGNSGGDVLKDVLGELIKSLSTATYSGFGSPGSNVADLAQLLIKIKTITG